MAKLKAPLMSLGAAGAIGKSLVFFGWKGLDVAREYVVPSNPRTSGQTTQRGYLTEMVTRIHAMEADALHPITEDDTMAYALWGSTFPTPRTWFNQAVKNGVDQRVAGLTPRLFGSGKTTPGANKLDVECWEINAFVTAGSFKYGTTKTALIHTQAATCAARKMSATLAGLVTGTKYYWQFEPTTPVSVLGVKSGIYYGVAA